MLLKVILANVAGKDLDPCVEKIRNVLHFLSCRIVRIVGSNHPNDNPIGSCPLILLGNSGYLSNGRFDLRDHVYTLLN